MEYISIRDVHILGPIESVLYLLDYKNQINMLILFVIPRITIPILFLKH